MSKLEKYSSYKDSGVEWLGEIPEEWEIQKVKNIFNFSKGLTITKDNLQEEGIYCVNYGEIHSKYGFEINPAIHALKCVDESYLKSDLKSLLNFGDFVFADTSEDIEGSGNFTHLNSNIKTFAGYHTVICRSKNSTNVRFFAYLFDSITYRLQIRKRVKGVKVYSITQGILKDTILWIPPKEEQTLIASFLDEKTTQIDEAISQKEKLIELLKERKQIVINDAVTKGLDKDVEFVDSGVEWIGEIPKHWEVVRSKRLFQQRKDRARKGDKQLTASQKYGVIYQDKYMELEGRRVTQVEYNHEILKRAEAGDFLISMRSFQGGIEYCRETGSVSSAYVALIPIKHIVPEYFKHLLKSQKYITALSSTSNLVRDGQALRFENFSMVDLLIVPNKEQLQIAKHIDDQTTKIDKAIELQQSYIAKLKEYKASLIDSVVTGKVRVI